MPFFSIIIPTYNRVHTLNVCLDSLANQQYKDFEIILVDDGSTDHTADFIKSNYPDERIKYIYQSNKGVCAARNTGVAIAKGIYICFLDSDDYVTKDWLSNFKMKFSSNDGVDVVFCNGINKHFNGKEVLLNANYPYNPFIKDDKGIYLAGLFAINRFLFERVGGFDEQIKFGEFTDLGFRINHFNPQTAFTHRVGMYYQISPEGGGKNLRNKIDSNLYFIKKHKDYFIRSPKVHQLFLQNIAVAYFKLNEFNIGRKYLWESLSKNIFNPKVLIRFLLSFSPMMYKKVLL